MVNVACALLLVGGAFLCQRAQEWFVGWVSCAEGRGSSACGLIHACLPAPFVSLAVCAARVGSAGRDGPPLLRDLARLLQRLLDPHPVG